MIKTMTQNPGEKIKDLIKTINGKPGDYYKKFTKIKFNSNNNSPLGKILSLHNMKIVVRYVFHEKDNKYYPQVFLYEC